VFVQSGELTDYQGSPPPQAGGPDFPGPSPARRLYAAADGWLAVAAPDGDSRTAFFAALGHPEWQVLSDAQIAVNVERELVTRPCEHWLDKFGCADVPAVRVLRRARGIADPYLTANEFSHVLEVPGLGSFRVVRSYSGWQGVTRGPGSNPAIGQDTVEVLSGAGVGTRVIEDLLARKVATAPETSRGWSHPAPFR
jgi:crotonobetainyl-CoA:carnitine CoA-transferase CaiB-like acyl-CoA transferase